MKIKLQSFSQQQGRQKGNWQLLALLLTLTLLIICSSTRASAQTQQTGWLGRSTGTEYVFDLRLPADFADVFIAGGKYDEHKNFHEYFTEDIDGTTYSFVKSRISWNNDSSVDNGNIQLERNGQYKWLKLDETSAEWTALAPRLIADSTPNETRFWHGVDLIILISPNADQPTVRLPIPQTTQAKNKMIDLGKQPTAGLYYPAVKIPADLEAFQAQMLAYGNAGRRDPDWRKNNGAQTATDLSGDTVITKDGKVEKVFKSSNTPPYFKDHVLQKELNQMAQFQAEYQASINTLGHDGPGSFTDPNTNKSGDLSTMEKRAEFFGTNSVVEAAGLGGLGDFPHSWMAGETHFRPWFNVDGAYPAIGYGAAMGSDGRWYFAAVAIRDADGSSASEPAQPEPAPAATDLRALERQILAEINKIRIDPAALAAALTTIKQNSQGEPALTLPDNSMITAGANHLDSAISGAQTMQPMGALVWSDGLAQAARNYAEQSPTGHYDFNSSPESRTAAFGSPGAGGIPESIGSGGPTALNQAYTLYIDSPGLDIRNRNILIDPKLTHLGVGCYSPNQQGKTTCVLDYATNWTDKNDQVTPEIGKQYALREQDGKYRYFVLTSTTGQPPFPYRLHVCPDKFGWMDVSDLGNLTTVENAQAENLVATNTPCTTADAPHGVLNNGTALPVAGSQDPGSAPATPAPGGRIAFKRNGDIYVMNPDGSGLTNLTNNPAINSDPSWSPDGKRIAFVSNRDNHGHEIYVMNADGSGQTRLTYNAGSDIDTKPDWSPDGKQIAFASIRGGNGEIYVMNADGSGLTNLTNSGAKDYEPVWSPDGKQIAFDSNREGVGNYEIYVMNADGSNVTRLTTSQANIGNGHSAWSPDGKQIAFLSNRDGNGEIYVMNADGSGQTRLTNNPAEDEWPGWSPDGKQIVFDSNRDGNNEIYVMNADGSGLTNLTNNAAKDWDPDWGVRVTPAATVGAATLTLEVGKQYAVPDRPGTFRYLKLTQLPGPGSEFATLVPCPDLLGTGTVWIPHIMTVEAALAQGLTAANQQCPIDTTPYGQ